MKTVILIIIVLALAKVLRYLIMRKPISLGATAGTCFGIMLFVVMMVSTTVEKKSQKQGDEEALAGGPVTILADLAGGMVKVGIPVLVASFFILRAKAKNDSD